MERETLKVNNRGIKRLMGKNRAWAVSKKLGFDESLFL